MQVANLCYVSKLCLEISLLGAQNDSGRGSGIR